MEMQDILGLNARNFRYTSVYNSAKTKAVANSKLLTKSTLKKHKLSSPNLYNVFRTGDDVDRFNFKKLPDTFVVKPNKGLGGEGIIVVEKRLSQEEWLDAEGSTVSVDDIKLHIEDILEGRFDPKDLPDIAFIEERIRIHPLFERYAYHGTPDIRIVVFNRIPVMAMLRIPTQESGGRANLFQGAVGAGIDLGSGVTTTAIQHSREVVFMPSTRRKIRGIAIPVWDEVLQLAVKCYEVTGLGFLGADIVLQPSAKDPDKTIPKVLELNAQPGLKIQLANRAGLLRRLQRVEGLKVISTEQGISIGKELFADRTLAHLGKKVKQIGVFEPVKVVDQLGRKVTVNAKVDTGAFRTSIDRQLAQDLGLLRSDNVVMKRTYESALGKSEREVIGITLYLAGRKIQTTASVADRTGRRRPMLIGRRDLKGYTIHFA